MNLLLYEIHDASGIQLRFIAFEDKSNTESLFYNLFWNSTFKFSMLGTERENLQLEKFLKPETIERFRKTFGPIELLNYAQTIMPSILVALNKDDYENVHLIHMTKEVPHFPEDYFHFHCLRAITRSAIWSAKCIRDEERERGSISFVFGPYTDLADYFAYGTSPRDQEKPKRIIFILTRQMDREELLSTQFYRHEDAKFYIMMTEKLMKALENKEDKELLEFIKERQIEFVEDPIADISQAAKYLTEKKGIRNVLYEVGTTTYANLLEDPDIEAPAEITSLTVFHGKTNPIWVGKKHPSFPTLQLKYDLVHQSDEYQHSDGTLRFFTFVKKGCLEKWDMKKLEDEQS